MAQQPSFMNLSDKELEFFLSREPTTSTPAIANVVKSLDRAFDTIDGLLDCFPTPLPSNLPDAEVLHDYEVRMATAETERRTADMQLRALPHRQKVLEESHTEERGRRMAYQEMWEKSAILRQEPGRQGPAIEPAAEHDQHSAVESVRRLGHAGSARLSSLHRPTLTASAEPSCNIAMDTVRKPGREGTRAAANSWEHPVDTTVSAPTAVLIELADSVKPAAP